MKVVITESRRDKLAKQELDKEFSNMYEDVNYITDGVGEQKRIKYRNDPNFYYNSNKRTN